MPRYFSRYGRGRYARRGARKYFPRVRRATISAANPPYGRRAAVPPAMAGMGFAGSRSVERALVRSSQQAELKVHSVSDAAQNISGTTDVFSMADIAQGATATNDTRVGNRINVKYVDFSGIIRINSSATSGTVTVALVWDEAGNPTPLWDDVFDYPGSNPGVVVPSLAMSGRYKILAKRTFALNPTTTTPTIPFKFKRIPINRQIIWSTSAATTQHSGDIWLMIGSDNVGPVQFHNYDFISSLVFTDV